MSDAKLVNTRNLAPSALPSLLPVASKGISGTTGSEGPAGNQITESDERNPQDTGIIGGKSDPCRVAKGKETASHVMTGSYLALEAAEMAGTLAGAVIGGTTGLAVISIGMTALAASHIKEGIAEKSSEKILEGTGAGILAARTGFGALSLAGHGAEEGLLHSVSEGANSILKPLGVAHGAVDVAVGSKKLYDGIHEKDKDKVVTGSMGIGMGLSLAAAALGGGVPAVVAAALFLGGKVLYQERETIKGYFG